MNSKAEFLVMLFPAVSYVLKAEKILKKENIPHRLIPIPRNIDSDCGICLRFQCQMKERVEDALKDKVQYDAIHAAE